MCLSYATGPTKWESGPGYRKPSMDSGQSRAHAIFINCTDPITGVDAEYEYLERTYGLREVNWKFINQALILNEDGTKYDVLSIQLQDGAIKNIWFDIHRFYGNFDFPTDFE